ncbi:MAG: hypothetical protein WCO00_09865 [Rhodospirillaceae bacterium]
MRMTRAVRGGLLGLLLLLAALTAASPARAGQGAWPEWLPPVVTGVVLYGSLYATAFVVSQVARAGIVAVSAPGWVGVSQSFGMPAAIVAVMSQVIPALRVSVPEMVGGWFGTVPGPLPAPRPSDALSSAVSGS